MITPSTPFSLKLNSLETKISHMRLDYDKTRTYNNSHIKRNYYRGYKAPNN